MPDVKPGRPRVGIPLALGMYEDLPFWVAFFEGIGCEVVLSEESTIEQTERGAHTVMSDNVCYPAKVVHGHVLALQQRGVHRIFFPFVVYEEKGIQDSDNTYNCPIVSGYGEVIRSAMHEGLRVAVDSPTISFKDDALLQRQCEMYVEASEGWLGKRGRKAISEAVASGLRARRAFNERCTVET